MYVRVRYFGKPDAVIVVRSKLMKIAQFRSLIKCKLGVEPKYQRLVYGGKLLEDEYTFYDYNIKLNDVIQLFIKTQNDSTTTTSPENKNKEKIYKDATSMLYAVGDLIDMRDPESGAWFEGKIIKILAQDITHSNGTQQNLDKDSECQIPNKNINVNGSQSKEEATETPTTTPKVVENGQSAENLHIKDDDLIYKVQLDSDEDDSDLYSCSLKEIRPRARNVIDIEDLKIEQTVMVNYNADQPSEKGNWFDFKVSKIKKLGSGYELVGTLYLGPEAIPQDDTKIPLHDKVFAIEEVIPLADRNEEYQKTMVTPPEKRSTALTCLTCRDQEESPCKDCGCYLCHGKENPDKIVLCDECNKGYHMECLSPPLTQVPDDDWYCPSCKRDPTEVVAPGAAKQAKKEAISKRDWGRGMACVGKTKTCSMPANHFGPIPGIDVGMCWRFRIQLSESGVHRPPVSGIHGRDVEGAYSIVLSGGYEDDEDNGYEFTYTGSGGRDLSGNKRTAEQSCDQTLTRENKALARNCAVKQISEEGGDAGDNWRQGKPVRVVRSYKMLKHFPKYAPKEGIRYDGIYKVVKYYPEKGLSGYRVWKYLLRRDDLSPAPWESGAKQYPIVYPDGYLEAEAEKKALKENNGSGRLSRKRHLDILNDLDSKISKKRSGITDENLKVPYKNKRGLKKRTISPECSSDKITNMFRGCPKKYKHKKFTKENLQNCKEGSKEEEEKKQATVLNGKQEMENVNQEIGNDGQETENVNQETENDKQKVKSEQDEQHVLNGVESILTAEEKNAILADIVDKKLWQECASVSKDKAKKEFMEHVIQIFMCIVCQDVVTAPVTTPCAHIFCMACLKRAYKICNIKICPCCRQSLSEDDLILNENLQTALQTLMPGYDSGK